jgi:hypothetical protein
LASILEEVRQRAPQDDGRLVAVNRSEALLQPVSDRVLVDNEESGDLLHREAPMFFDSSMVGMASHGRGSPSPFDLRRAGGRITVAVTAGLRGVLHLKRLRLGH